LHQYYSANIAFVPFLQCYTNLNKLVHGFLFVCRGLFTWTG
jgi:hypothetical protein